jgi:hypothetical protein
LNTFFAPVFAPDGRSHFLRDSLVICNRSVAMVPT